MAKITQGPPIVIPAGGWEFYYCMKDDILHRIEVDLSLSATAPMPEFPYVFKIKLPFLVKPNLGLFDETEDEKLESASKQYTQTHGKHVSWLDRITNSKACSLGNVILAGSETVPGERRYYYYAQGEKIDERELNKCFPEYSISVAHRHDPKWRLYLDDLHPGSALPALLRNAALLQLRAEQGDDITHPRDVDHTLVFSTEEGRKSFLESVQDDDWEIHTLAGDKSNETPPTYSVIITREHNTDRVSTDIFIIALHSRANQFGGRYDGWGSFIVKKATSQ